MLVSLDLETICAIRGCSGKGCEHALFPHQARVTVVGLFFRRPGLADYFATSRDLSKLPGILEGLGDYELTGHNLRFDLKMLAHNGIHIPIERWAFDSQVAAALSVEKVSPEYLREYERLRQLENKKLPRGYSHRQGTQHSLKVLAPYFLKVAPFWEDPTNHDNDGYLRKDVEYAYDLVGVLRRQLQEQELLDFFEKKLMPWSRMLLEAEIEGVPIDLTKLEELRAAATEKGAAAKEKLDQLWAAAYRAKVEAEEKELEKKYGEMARLAISKLKTPTAEKINSKWEKYGALCGAAKKKIEPFNLNSSDQLSWLFRDYFGLDITNFSGDESTGKEVLQRLAAEGREDVKTFLEYRHYNKQVTAFFPSYLDLQHNGIIHCNFNPDIAKTGRLTSNGPNLQQVPGELHQLFIPPAGMLMNSSDMSAIEAKLIAYYSEDPNLCALVMSGDDFHGFNVVNAYFPELKEQGITPAMVKAESGPGQRFHVHRKLAKELGYALFYGAGADRIMSVAQKHGFRWSKQECQTKLRHFKRAFAGAFAFKDLLDEKAYKGEIIRGLLGRGRRFTNSQDVFMQNFNSLIQGSASDLVLNSGYRIRTRFKESKISGGPRLFIHDEIVSIFPEGRRAESEEIIQTSMVDYKLETKFGLIPLQSESKTAAYWAK